VLGAGDIHPRVGITGESFIVHGQNFEVKIVDRQHAFSLILIPLARFPAALRGRYQPSISQLQACWSLYKQNAQPAGHIDLGSGVNPHVWLIETLTKLASGHLADIVAELMPRAADPKSNRCFQATAVHGMSSPTLLAG
jgi:hypothetical protein